MATKNPRPQCYAYYGGTDAGIPSTVRCELPAGHAGDHRVSVAWDDGMCYVPILTARAAALLDAPKTGTEPPLSGEGAGEVIGYGSDGTPLHRAVPANDTERACIGCGHRHRGGSCRRGCECQEFI